MQSVIQEANSLHILLDEESSLDEHLEEMSQEVYSSGMELLTRVTVLIFILQSTISDCSRVMISRSLLFALQWTNLWYS